ncbi:efflux RND transporter periplasmic adaptor subunit [Ammoniphilus resinae]|uniref:HlyD family secretion protein n=1 Tax=Ammoniphilus resinae TaxID=861532 RepID=A0ABS4GVU7_9BACL|nr:efflux RND transporter periplasmic adaptor subunit [Ammoniphilus resinae]MBP1934400.1 HlyD family secretion protein [Ammoniphilus resinae]
MKKKLSMAISIVVFIAIVFMFLQNQTKSMDVIGYEIKDTTYKEMISSIGSVEYDKVVAMKAEVSGTLGDMNGEVGDKIKAGELVAKIDDRQARIELEEIQTNSNVAKARYEDYMKSYSQNEQAINDQRVLQENEIASLQLEQSQLKTKIVETKTLVEAGALPSKDLTNLNEQLAALELRIQSANKRLESLRSPVLADQELKASIEAASAKVSKQKLLLDKYTVKAPMDGIVMERIVEPGAFVQAGEVIMKMASDRHKYAVVDMDEKYLNDVALGKEAQITTEAYPDDVVKGMVESISPEIDKDSGTVRVKVKINDQTDLFLQNMSVKVEFVGQAYDQAIVIPGDYLINDETPAVYIKGENGKAVKQKIVIANKNAKDIMVLKGLSAGMVLLDPEKLEEGMEVNVTLSEESEKGR